MQKHYEITIQPHIGPGHNDAKEALVLNRVIRWTSEGIEYEADPRQAEKIVTECGLEGAKTVVTPGVKVTREELGKDVTLNPDNTQPIGLQRPGQLPACEPT